MSSLKKLFILIMAVVAGTHAAVLTYQETFNDVKVISPAKSTVEEGDHRRNADYDVGRYKGKGSQIMIVYSFTPGMQLSLIGGWFLAPKA